MFLGIDPTSSDAKPSGCAVLDSDGRFVDLTYARTDGDILDLGRKWSPCTVAIDSPFGFPNGMCCLEETCACRSVHDFKGRVCERELVREGIPLYFTTKRCIIKRMVYRSRGLASEFSSMGSRVLEVYPYGSKVRLFGKPIPKKTTPQGIEFLMQRLVERIPGLGAYRSRIDHDGCDALIVAYTAYLHSRGRTESVGLEEEVPIVLPRAARSGATLT